MTEVAQVPFRLPSQLWFTTAEAAAALGLSSSMVEKLYDEGKLTGHSHNAGKGRRKHRRILRVSLVTYAITTADYDADCIGTCLTEALPFLPKRTLMSLADTARRLAS